MRWALALFGLGRLEEAGACEAEARRIERMIARLEKRAEVARAEEGVEEKLVGEFLERVGEAIGQPGEDWAAWEEVTLYFAALARLGAEVTADGQVVWPHGVPPDVAVPDWLPEPPWAVMDVERWEREVGAAMRVL